MRNVTLHKWENILKGWGSKSYMNKTDVFNAPWMFEL